MSPPGRARLRTSPTSTGTQATEKTIGIVLVASFAANGPATMNDEG